MVTAAHTQTDINNLVKNSISDVKNLSDNIAKEIIACTCLPVKYWRNEIQIDDKTVKVSIDNQPPSDRFSMDKIVGTASGYSDLAISVNGLARSQGTDQKFYEAITESESNISIRISHTIIHELVHILQKLKNDDYFHTGDGAQAVDAGCAVKRSMDDNTDDKVDKYLSYLNCTSELEAHSAQLAAEMFLRFNGNLSEEEYRDNAKSSDLHTHIMKKTNDTSTEEMTNIINRIIEKSWLCYHEL